MTHNIEGHDRSLSNTQSLLEKFQPDYFLRQEDWLYGYQHFKLSEINNKYIGLGKSVDFDNPALRQGTTKAKWGLDTLFKKEHNSCTNELDEFSNQRIQVIKINSNIPLIIINVYLPSSSLPEADYEATLVLLSVAIEKYSSEAACILSGDFNRSLFRKSSNDKKFQQFCSEMGLLPAEGSTDQPTYHGYNGSTSRIDYVLLHRDSCTSFGLKTENVNILNHICKDDNSDIISTHDAILFEVEYNVKNVSKKSEDALGCESIALVQKSIDWENADIENYQSVLDSLLEQNFLEVP